MRKRRLSETGTLGVMRAPLMSSQLSGLSRVSIDPLTKLAVRQVYNVRRQSSLGDRVLVTINAYHQEVTFCQAFLPVAT